MGTDRIMCAQGCGHVALKAPGAAKASAANAIKPLDAHEKAAILLKDREESIVACTLLDIVQQAPNEQISAAQLCSALYQKCASAKVVIHDYGGLKHFVASPVLKEVVEFHANEVLLSTICLNAIMLRIFCSDCILYTLIQGCGIVVATSHGKWTSCTRTHVVTLPRRPDKYPCPFYLETGDCAYGGSCKFDHPSRNSQLHRHETPFSAATGGAKERPKDTILNRQMSISGIDVRNESDIMIRHRVQLETGAKEGVGKEKETAGTARGMGAAEGPVSQAAQEKEVADHLLDIVRQATGGRIFAAQLCSALYQKCDIAKVVIQNYKGLKHFVASPVLKEAVEFHADEVYSGRCICMY